MPMKEIVKPDSGNVSKLKDSCRKWSIMITASCTVWDVYDIFKGAWQVTFVKFTYAVIGKAIHFIGHMTVTASKSTDIQVMKR